MKYIFLLIYIFLFRHVFVFFHIVDISVEQIKEALISHTEKKKKEADVLGTHGETIDTETEITETETGDEIDKIEKIDIDEDNKELLRTYMKAVAPHRALIRK